MLAEVVCFCLLQAMFSRFPNYFGGLATDKFEEMINYKRTAPSFNGIGSEASGTQLLDLEEVPSYGSMFDQRMVTG